MADRSTDIRLKYYVRMTKSDYLHLGYWNLEDDLTMDNLRRAQERYAGRLLNFIPEGVERILDVGCGVGGNALRLKKEGYQVEALSPDPSQEEMFKAKTRGEIPFHLSRFEDLETDTKYDLILMSESVQYIKPKEGFDKSRHFLKEGGFLLTADYYLKKPLPKNNVLSEGGHIEEEYLKAARDNGFEVIKSEDITPYVTPTFEFARLIYDSYVLPTLDLFHDFLKVRVAILYKIVRFLFGKKIVDLFKYEQLIDSRLFAEHKRYMIYLFQKGKIPKEKSKI